MKRTIEQYLLDWKNRTDRVPLIVRGARQVGKTYILERFAEENFDNCLAINLEEKPELKKVFKDNDVKRIITELSVIANEPVKYNNTLLFIDEIQTCPEAILTLRYFKEKLPELHVVCAGSLLEHALNELNIPMPVGRVEFLYMYPLSFKEYLNAIGQNRLVDYIESFNFENPFSEVIHNKILQYLRFYFFIGGMPAVVKNYIENENLSDTQRIHHNILTSIQYDFAKYGTKTEQQYLQIVLNYCGRNIGKKVKYSNIDSDTRSTYLKEAIRKLELSRIIHRITHSNSGKVPLTDFENRDIYKTIFMDIGFVNHMSQIELVDIESLVTSNEGMLAEQFVGQEILTQKEAFYSPELFYWVREAKSSNAEVDYLFQFRNKIYPIEVKAGKTGALKSMHVYLYEKRLKNGIRFYLGLPDYSCLTNDVRVQNQVETLEWNLLSLPLYMVSEVNRLIDIKFVR